MNFYTNIQIILFQNPTTCIFYKHQYQIKSPRQSMKKIPPLSVKSAENNKKQNLFLHICLTSRKQNFFKILQPRHSSKNNGSKLESIFM